MELPTTPRPAHRPERIFCWLSDQPSVFVPASTRCPTPASALSTRKHGRATAINASPPPIKRQKPLQPTSANISQRRQARSQSPTKKAAALAAEGVVQSSNIAAEERGRRRLAKGNGPALLQSPTKPARRLARVSVAQDHVLDEGYDDEYEDGGRTPTAKRSPARQGRASSSPASLPQLPKDIPILSSRGSGSDYSNAPSSRASTASNVSDAANARERSPTRTLADLILLDKPVTYNDNHDDGRHKIPKDVQELWDDLEDIAFPHIPRPLVDEFKTIKRPTDVRIMEDSRPPDKLRYEFWEMTEVQDHAHKIAGDSDHETQWYCSVHGRILNAAFRTQPFMEPRVVTHARPIEYYLPKIAEKYTGSKLVDLAVNLVLPPEPLSTKRWIANQPTKLRSVNQSLYPPLTINPTVLNIEVKTERGNEADAKVQMGIWISAWHTRVLQVGAVPGNIITLPVIISIAHKWDLYFAVDRGGSIEMLHFPGDIGGTQSIANIYKLLAVLRRIGQYAQHVYRPWFVKAYFGVDLEGPES